MHRILRTFSGVTVVAALAMGTAFAQGQPAQQKKVKDQGEYDIFTAVTKETDMNKKIQLLDTWKQKYPDSEFKEDRLVIYRDTYQKLGKPDKMLEASKEILSINPKDITSQYWISLLTPAVPAAANDAGMQADAEKAANGLLNAEKPAATKDEDWQKAKKDLDTLARKTLGWVAMVRKQPEQAEQEFTKNLQLNPNDAQVSYWLGTAVMAEKNPEKYGLAFWSFARAVSHDGTGALPPDDRKKIDAYLTKIYTTFHGSDPQGLQALKEQAKAAPLPPGDFKIESASAIAAKKEAEFEKSNPQLALWMRLKKELTGPNGEQYFESSMKGAAVPPLRGKLVAAKPPARSSLLVIGIENESPEITLKLDAPLGGKPEIGSELEFEGVPAAFTKDPFMVTFDVEKAKITGLKMEAPPRPAAKKAGAKKKK